MQPRKIGFVWMSPFRSISSRAHTAPFLIIDYVLHMFSRKKYMNTHALNPAEIAQF